MACCHIHGITYHHYNGSLTNEREILALHDFGVEEKIQNGTRVKHITFNPEKKVYWSEYGVICGRYPKMESCPDTQTQYHIRLQCGGRISGACGSYIKEVQFFRELPSASLWQEKRVR